MADELLNLDNLRAVLEEYGKAVAEQYKANLKRDGRPASHKLENSIETFVEVDGQDFVVRMRLEEYWKYIEYGTKGWLTGNTQRKFPPVSALLNWIQVKPVIPRPDANGRIPTPQQLAFLIGRKIRDFGTQGRADLTEAKMEVTEQWRERIEAALQHDMYDYIRKVLAPGTK